MDSPVLEEMLSHLDFLGYQIERKEGYSVAGHPRHYNMVICEYPWGVLCRVFFGTSDDAKHDRGALLEGINSFNRTATVCRGYLDGDMDFVFEAVFPKLYDGQLFGVFLDAICDDLGRLDDEGIYVAQYIG